MMTEGRAELIPVDQSDGYFVVSRGWLQADIPFPDASEREALVDRGYVASDGIVHFDGRARRATIFRPSNNDDQMFADLREEVVDSETDDPVVEVGDFESYWHQINERFGRSEGVLPEQCTEIVSGFVEPRLALSETEHEITWGRLRENSYLLISGAPGSGKTTLLRQWMLWHADRARKKDSFLLPLCLSLRAYNPDETVEMALRREAAASAAPWLALNLKAHALKGALAIAFDGLDEVPFEDRAAALSRLAEFSNLYPDCRYLVTTRPGINIHLDVGLLRAELLPFDSQRLRQLAYYKLHSRGSWKSFATRVEAEPALEWATGNPLALSLILARYLRHEFKPSFVGEIISAVVDLFVDSWDASRGVVRTRTRTFSPSAKRKMLAWVAENRDKPADDIPLLESFEDVEESGELLTMLSEHTGLLKKNGEGNWQIRNRVLEDYFRAMMWVSALTSKAGDFRALLRRPLASAKDNLERFIGFMSSDTDEQIREVLKKVAGPELATAVRLTGVVSERGSLRPSTLIQYAKLVTEALEEPLRGAHYEARPLTKPYVFCFSVSYSQEVGSYLEDLEALVAALHRTRDGSGAKAVKNSIEGGGSPHLLAIVELLNADGELSVHKTEHSLTWTVAEILPQIPAGPTSPIDAAEPQAIH